MIYLIPKWYLLRNKIAYTIGVDSEVEVSELIECEQKGKYEVIISTDDKKKGRALNTLIKSKQHYGDIIVNIKVTDKKGNIYNSCDILCKDNIVECINDAFKDNNLYVTTIVPQMEEHNAIYPIFKPIIVQFFNDDLSDYYNNYNGYPAQIFKEILNVNIIGIPLLVSTDMVK